MTCFVPNLRNCSSLQKGVDARLIGEIGVLYKDVCITSNTMKGCFLVIISLIGVRSMLKEETDNDGVYRSTAYTVKGRISVIGFLYTAFCPIL